MHIQTTRFSTQEIFPSGVVTGMVTRSFYYRGHSWHKLTQKSTAHPHWPCFPPMEDTKSFQVCHQPLFSSYKNPESSWDSLQPAWEFPLGGEAAPFCLSLCSSHSFLFFSGPDLDKLAASFLRLSGELSATHLKACNLVISTLNLRLTSPDSLGNELVSESRGKM